MKTCEDGSCPACRVVSFVKEMGATDEQMEEFESRLEALINEAMLDGVGWAHDQREQAKDNVRNMLRSACGPDANIHVN